MDEEHSRERLLGIVDVMDAEAADLERWADEKAAKRLKDGGRVPIFTKRASEIEPKPVKWLWKDRLALGKPTIYASPPGLGKSLTTKDIAAMATRGGPWPAGEEGSREPADVLMANYEDDLADTVVPRLQAAGADLSRVHFLYKVPTEDGPKHFDLKRDLDRLNDHLAMHPEVRLLIVDPISAAMGGVDHNSNSDVRNTLAPLIDVIQHHEVALLAVSHFPKSGGRKAIHSVIGSIAFTAAARIAFIAARDEEDPSGERHLFLPIKSNIGDDRVGLAYYKRGTVLPSGIEAWKIVWGERVDVRADAVVAAMEEESGALGDAKTFLSSLLEEGPVPATTIQAEANKNGISRSTLNRAKESLGIKPHRDGKGVRASWIWELPKPKQGRIWQDKEELR